ncbi:MAG: ArsA family ATPase, partial [Cyanobacteria bacterium J06636_16]
LEAGRAAVQSPHQVLGFLVTSGDANDVAMVRHLWGCAQRAVQKPLLVLFCPLVERPSHCQLSALPQLESDNWDPLQAAVPAIAAVRQAAPAPVVIDEAAKQVRLFLPGFTKADIGLTQYGPEVTVTAGDHRRNLQLPTSLSNRAVQGAKFQEDALILSF